MSTATFHVGDTRKVLALLADEGTQVDLVMTSPPFLALRSYLPDDHPDKASEIGSEATPAAFLSTLLDVTEACAAVLAPHGSICVELGDTYAGSGGAGGDYADGGLRDGQAKFRQQGSREHRAGREGTGADGGVRVVPVNAGNGWPLDKSLTLIPTLYAASLAYGRNLLDPERTTDPWRIRNVVAWVRPNPPVGALGDKVRPATSYLTWATRSRTRYFDLDAVRTAPSANTHARVANGAPGRTDLPSQQRDGNWNTLPAVNESNPAGAPPLDWWSISPGGFSGSHYAVFPAELCRIPIEASCPRRVCRTCGEPSRRLSEVSGMVDSQGREVERHVWTSGIAEGKAAHSNKKQGGTTTTTTTGWTSCGCPGTEPDRLDGYHTDTGWRPGIVLDPFGGSGTTGIAATGLSRDAILIDLDERNLDLARERLGMFLTEGVPA